MSIALRGLGRNSEAEEEMTRAAECAKKLEKEEKEEEKDWIDISCTELRFLKRDLSHCKEAKQSIDWSMGSREHLISAVTR